MTSKLAQRFRSTTAQLHNGAMRRAEEGMATAEWALVTLAACAFAIVLIVFLAGPGASALGSLLAKMFSKAPL